MRQVFACPGQCVSRTRLFLAFALALLLAPVAAWAAPYADYVIDVRTGEVLHQENANTRLHPASLTKMMTLYIAFEAIERGEITLDSRVTISKHAAAQPPSRLGLKPGQTIALRYLIRAAAIKSANDAATAIGEAIEGSEPAFARRMNRTAKALGMTRSTFVNANGLTAKGHLSSAHDMALLGRHLFYDYPQYYNIFSRTSADAGVAQVASTNRRFLSAYKGADGIKTGYTTAAGFNLVASAHRGNKHVIAAVFGGKSTADRNARAAALLDMGFAKSPNRAAVQKPGRPAYSAPEEQDLLAAEPELIAEAPAEVENDATAEAIARAVTTAPDAVAAGKTIRLQVAVAQSPRPRGRPAPGAPVAAAEAAAEAVADGSADADAPAGAPGDEAAEELLVAMQDDIAAALAEAQALDLDAGTEAAEAAIAGPAETPATEVAEADAAPTPEAPVAEAPLPEGPVFAQTTTPQPETALALAAPAEDSPAEDAPAVAPLTLAAASLANLPALRPAARPSGAAATPGATAETPAAATAPEAPATALAAAPAPAATEPPATAAPAAAKAEAPVVAVAEAPAPAPAPAPTPKSRPAEVVLAAYTPAEAEPAELEVVTRVSTSGGRQWAINVGHYGSRYDAERQLLQVALVEMATLGDALRKPVARRGGYEAHFVGMTEEMANLACRRLQARQTECAVVGP